LLEIKFNLLILRCKISADRAHKLLCFIST